MKTTSRGSMRKLMDNMMEHDQDDRQVSTSVVIEMRSEKLAIFGLIFTRLFLPHDLYIADIS